MRCEKAWVMLEKGLEPQFSSWKASCDEVEARSDDGAAVSILCLLCAGGVLCAGGWWGCVVVVVGLGDQLFRDQLSQR
jgi:hypothetical protein